VHAKTKESAMQNLSLEVVHVVWGRKCGFDVTSEYERPSLCMFDPTGGALYVVLSLTCK